MNVERARRQVVKALSDVKALQMARADGNVTRQTEDSYLRDIARLLDNAQGDLPETEGETDV